MQEGKKLRKREGKEATRMYQGKKEGEKARSEKARRRKGRKRYTSANARARWRKRMVDEA